MTSAVQQAQHIYLTPFVLTPDYQETIYLARTIPGDTERVNHSHLRLTPPSLPGHKSGQMKILLPTNNETGSYGQLSSKETN